MKQFIKMPTGWIQHEKKLLLFTGKDVGDGVAALKLYIAIALRANDRENSDLRLGETVVTYDMLSEMTSLSRALIARGIEKLKTTGIVSVEAGHANRYLLTNYDANKGWGKLPCSIYKNKYEIKGFRNLSPRNRASLNALKLYLLVVAFRSRATNYASISHEKIEANAGIRINDVATASSILASNELIKVHHIQDATKGHYYTVYRPSGLEPHMHYATLPAELKEQVPNFADQEIESLF